MSYTVREISDGAFDYPRESLLPKNGDDRLAAQFPPVISVPYRPLLVHTGGRTVLLDTGAGPLAPSTGQLQTNLQRAQVRPDDVDLIVLSHAHADHIGGLLDGAGRPAFPNARIVIGRSEYDFWRHSGIRERLGSGAVYGNPAIESVVGQWFDQYLIPLEQQLEFVDGEAEVSPGITMIPASGHTPGHTVILIHDDAEPLLFMADAFAMAEQIAQPEWVSAFDLDAARTVETRRILLDRAAADRYRVVHYHVSSIGRVVRHGTGYAWEPESAATSARAIS